MKMSRKLHAPSALPARKQPLVPITEEGGWVPWPGWMLEQKTQISAPTGNQTLIPGHPVQWLEF